MRIPHTLLLLLTLGSCNQPPALPSTTHASASEINPSEKQDPSRWVGRLGIPMGKLCTIQGVLIKGPSKGYEGGPNLRVQRINGRPIQEATRVPIRPYFLKWGDGDLPAIAMGKTYELRGYPTGGFVGVPGNAMQETKVILQTTDHYFRECFSVIKGQETPLVVFTPADFMGQEAMLEGVAINKDGHAFIQGEGWRLRIQENGPWDPTVEKKQVHTIGRIGKGSDGADPTVARDTCHLSRLEDQLNRSVSLRGRARSWNGMWWFHYRGTDLYVENMEKLPGWTGDNHWRPMVIRGKLAKESLPALDQISLKDDRDLKPYFIVKNASWEPLDHLLAPEEERDDED